MTRVRLSFRIYTFSLILAFFLIASSAAYAQSAAFTFQGRLTDSTNPADGLYDMRFKLFDTPDIDTGTQQGATLTHPTVQVVNGVFSVELDFGPNAFNGAARYLEISIRPTGNLNPHIILGPRQPIASTPYAVKSMTAASADALSGACVGCVTSSQIQNISASQVATGTLPVAQGGTGLSSAGAFGSFLRSNGSSWTSSLLTAVDIPAGSNRYIQNSTTQQQSSNFNISGDGLIGGSLSVGSSLGSAGFRLYVIDPSNRGLRVENFTSGGTVASFGKFGDFQIDGNTALGGRFTVKENGKVGVGESAPGFKLHVIDEANKGLRVQTSVEGGTVASFGGFGDFQIDAFSAPGGRLTVNEDGKVGLGVSEPAFKLHVIDTGNIGLRVQTNTGGGTVASFGGFGDFQIDASGTAGGRLTIKENGFVGIGTNAPNDKLHVNGFIRFNSLGAAGSTTLCRNGSNQIAACSSSLRYKTNIDTLHTGLNLINRLRPVTFDWKESKAHDLGLVAEEVAEVEPLLVIHNDKGEIEGVKYDRINVVLVNAIKEQQSQIASLEKENLEIKARLAALERLILQPLQAGKVAGNRQ